jgi:hypothetical protein
LLGLAKATQKLGSGQTLGHSLLVCLKAGQSQKGSLALLLDIELLGIEQELLLRLTGCFSLLLGIETQLSRPLTGLISGLLGTEVEFCLTLTGTLLSAERAQTVLGLLQPSRPVCLKEPRGLIKCRL